MDVERGTMALAGGASRNPASQEPIDSGFAYVLVGLDVSSCQNRGRETCSCEEEDPWHSAEMQVDYQQEIRVPRLQ